MFDFKKGHGCLINVNFFIIHAISRVWEKQYLCTVKNCLFLRFNNMKKFLLILAAGLLPLCATLQAQQLPNSGFEDWSGTVFDGKAQPKSWNYSNVTQFGFKFNFAHQEAGHSGSYCAMVQDQEVGAAGITEVSPGYLSLGQPWVYIESLTKVNYATAGTYGGISWTNRPDSMQVWIKRTGNNVLKEDFHLLYYAWKGNAKGDKYKGKNGSCTSVSYTNEESDVRRALNGNECGTTTLATQIAEGWIREKKEYPNWTCINVPIYYMSDEVPEKCNVIFSASNYPNFRANSGLYAGNSLYIDDIKMIYSSQIQSLYIDGKKWNGFVPTMTEEQTYSLGEKATTLPEIYAVRGEGSLSNSKGETVNFQGRRLSGSEITITNGVIDGTPTTITVRAADGSTTTTYKIKFVRAASTNSRLGGVKINGNDMAGFNAYTFNYTYELPYGTTAAPVIDVVKAEDAQTVQITQATSATGKATIVVTAADKKTKSTYTIQFAIAKLDDNTLSNILIDGESLIGFLPTKNIYTVELPLGTTAVPTITPVSAYKAGEQTIVATNNGLNGTYTIAVSAPGNPTTRTYKLNFKITASSFVELADIQVAGYPIDFTPGQKVYYVSLPLGTSTLPAVTPTPGDKYQTITKTTETNEEGQKVVKILVTAANGDQLTYKVVFDVQLSSNNYLTDIKLNGQSLEGFAATKNTYNVDLPVGTTALPTVTYTKGDEYQEVALSSSSIDPTDHTAKTRITVTAGNGMQNVYVINYTIATADNTTLNMVYVNGEEIPGFSPAQLTYDYALPSGTKAWPTVTFDKHDEYQTVTAQKGMFSTSKANPYTLSVKSGSGSIAKYVITFTIAAASNNANLAGIKVGGTAIEGFSATTLNYTYNLPQGTTKAPTIAADKAETAQTVQITQATSVTGKATIKVTAADKKTTKTYTVQFAVAQSSNVALSSIKVGGTQVTGFNAETLEYSVQLPLGTTTLPAVTFTKGDASQTVTARNETTNLNGDYKLVVAAPSGATRTYIIHFTLSTSSNASLNMIYVGGTAVAGFSATKTSYQVSLPQGTTSVPAITFDKGDQYQTVTVNTGALNAETEIVVKAADGKTSKIYTLTFTVQKANNTTLNAIYVGGVVLEGFSANTTSYNYNLSSKTTSLPAVTFDKADASQTVTVRTDAMSGLTGDYKLVVTAQSGDTRTYTIHFEVVVSSNSNLGMIKIGGTNLAGFTPTKKDYNYSLPVGTTSLPAITWTLGDEGQTVTKTEGGVNGKTTLVVKAENLTTSTYTITFSVEKANNTTLNMIYVGGEALEGFSATTTSYDVDLKSTTTVLPQVTYDVHDAYQTVNVRTDGMSGLEGDYKIVVTAQTGESRVYTLHFSIVISANANLQAIYLDGNALSTFKPGTLDYTVNLPIGTTEAPAITWLEGDEFQTITTSFHGLDGRNDIVVTAQDGTKRTYSIKFEVIQNTNSKLSMIAVGGVNIPSFDTDVLEYTVTLPQGTTTVPAITYTKNVESQQVTIVYGAIDTDTRVIVKAENGNTTGYTLRFVVPVSANNALSDLKVGGTTVTGFNPATTTYNVVLPFGTTELPAITATAGDEWQKVVVTKGTVTSATTICVIAQNGAERIYTINFSIAKSSNAALQMIYLDGTPLAGFSATTYSYTKTLALEATACPVITIEKATPGQSVTISQPKLSGDAVITVLSEDETAEKTYTVKFRINDTRSDVSTLAGVEIGGVALAGFAPNTYKYNKELAAGTTSLPTINPIKGQAGQTVSITKGTVNDTTFIRVLAENQQDETIYKIRFSVAVSTSAELAELNVDGVNILVPGQYYYEQSIGIGQTSCPEITVVKGEENQNVVITTPDRLGEAVVTVMSASGTTQTYTINFTSNASSDVTLTDIKVGGSTIDGFDPSTTYYDIYLPVGTTALPTIEFTKAVSSQTVQVLTAGPNAAATIYVTAEDGTSGSYTLNFATPLEDIAALSSIKLNGTPLAGFLATKYDYSYTLPAGATAAPVITATASTPRQTLTIVQPQLTGVGQVIVRAEDGTENTYSININFAQSSDATLKEIKLDGVLLLGFAPTTYNYNLTISTAQAEGPMEITYTEQDSMQTIMLVNNGVDGAKIIVRSETGVQKQYVINYSVIQSDYAGLAGLRFYDAAEEKYVDYEDFDPATFTYTKELARHTTEVPVIYPIKSYDAQIVTITYGKVNEPTTIEVTAETGATATYTINFPVAKSSNTKLGSLMLFGNNCDVTQTAHVCQLPQDWNYDPSDLVAYEKAEPEQSVEYVFAPHNQTSTIKVIAENGDELIYTITFTIEQPKGDNILTRLYIPELDQELSLKDKTKRAFDVELPYGSRTMTVEYNKNYPEQTVFVQPGGVNHPTVLTVKSNKAGVADEVYTLTPIVPTADPAVLTDIKVNGTTISGFTPEQFSYIVPVTGKPTLKYAINKGAEINITYQSSKHWQAEVSYGDRTNVYDVWYYYTNDVIPNGEFTEWTSCTTYTSAQKPKGWNTVADALGKHSGFGSFTPNQLVVKQGTDIVHLSTKYSTPGGGEIPGFITLGKVTGKWGVAGSTNIDVSGSISFHNSPDQMKIRYYSMSVENNNLIQYTLSGSDGEGALEWKEGKASTYSEHTYDLSAANAAAGDPTQLNITLCSYYTTGATTLSSSPEMYVDWVRIFYNHTLSGLKVNGATATLSGSKFSSTLADPEYIERPQLTFIGQVADQAQTVAWGEETISDDYGVRTATVINYAENGTDHTDYTIEVKRPLCTNATLDSLYIGGVKYASFDPATLNYTINILPTDSLPDIYPFPGSSRQTIQTTLNGKVMTVKVTPESGAAKTYTITFNVVRSNSTAISLAMEGISFDPATTSYNITAATWPELTFLKSLNGQKVTYTDKPLQRKLVVLAEDGTTSKTYTINRTLPQTISGKMQNFRINGTETIVTDGVYTYNTDKEVTSGIAFARTYCEDGVVETFNEDNITWAFTSVDNTITNNYTLNFTKTLSDDATLGMIYVDGAEMEGFNASVTEYDYTSAVKAYRVDAVANDENAILDITYTDKTATITVSSEDGAQHKTYTVTFKYQANTNSQLAMIYLNGTPITNFHPTIFDYSVELTSAMPKFADPAMPNITFDAGAPNQTIAVANYGVGGGVYIDVMAESGASSSYTINVSSTLASDAKLAGLYVNGKSILRDDRFEYNVVLPDENDPQVEYFAKTVSPYQDITYNPHATLDDPDEIIVTAENGNENTYFVNFTVDPAYHSANLKKVYLDGVEMTDFRSDIYTYNLILPAGTTVTPVIDAILTSDLQTVVTAVADLNETTTITVTAPDGVTEKTYNFFFGVEKSANADLLGISVDYTPIEGFDPAVTSYSLTVEGSVYSVQYVQAENEQKVMKVQDGDITKLIVIAENGTTKTYSLNVTTTVSAANNATLSNILVDGEALAGFMPSRTTYNVTLPVGSTTVPMIQAVSPVNNQTVTIVRGTLADSTNIHVVAEDGITFSDYKIFYSIARSTADTLDMIYLDGEPMADFDAYQTSYSMELPIGTRRFPYVSYVAGDAAEKVNIDTIARDNYKQQLAIRVLPEQGATRVYNINFSILKSDVDTLRMIYLDGAPLENFSADQLTYDVTLPVGSTTYPAVTYSEGNSYQNIVLEIASLTASTSSYNIIVTAENGTVRTYHIDMQIALSTLTDLRNILVNGETMVAAGKGYTASADFAESQYDYSLEWAIGTTALPQITYTAGDEFQNITILHTMSTINDSVVIRVAAENGNFSEYIVRSTLLHSYADTLKMIYVNNLPIDNFDAQQDTFFVDLAVGTRTLPEFETVKGDQWQTVTTKLLAMTTYETSYQITVLAEAGNSRNYVLVFRTAKSDVTDLGNIRINGETLAAMGIGYTADFDFAADQHQYNITWAIGSQALPIIEYTAGDEFQSVTTAHAMNSLEDSVVFITKAENGDEATYTLYNTLAHSYVDTLKMIYVNNLPLDNFSAEADSFIVNLEVGTRTLPEFEAVKGDQYQTISTRILAMSNYETSYQITVKAEAGNIRNYVLTFRTAKSDLTTLKNIRINGLTIETEGIGYVSDYAFAPDQFTYHLTWEVGTTILPAVTYTAGDDYQLISFLNSMRSLNDSLLINVMAENGDQQIYTIYSEVAHSAVDTLRMIYVNGFELENFDARQDTFVVELPVGTSEYPTYEAQKGEQWQSVSARIVSAGSFERTDLITVVAEDGVTTRNYTLIFRILKSNVASLNQILVNGYEFASLADDKGFTADYAFSADQYEYLLTWEVGTTTAPLFTYEQTDTLSTIQVVHNPYTINDSLVLRVYAQTGDFQTYRVYNQVLHSSVDTLAMIYSDASPIEGFDPYTTSYSVELPVGTRQFPLLEYQVGDEYQYVSMDTLLNTTYEAAYRINVVAEDGTSTRMYNVRYTILKSDKNYLEAIYLDGVMINSFRADSFEYTYTIPVGVDTLPLITYDQADKFQTVTLNQGTVDGDTYLTVTAENGTQSVYTLHFPILRSSNAYLGDIQVNNASISNFDKEQLTYRITLPYGTTSIPRVTPVAAEEEQIVTLNYDPIAWTASITVVAANGTSTNTYVLTFIVARSEAASLQMITVGGKPLADFAADKYEYSVNLPYGTTEMPQIEYQVVDTQEVVTLALDSAAWTATLTVRSGDESNSNEYTIAFIVEKNFENRLSDLMIDSVTIEGFDAEVLEYNFVYPAGSDSAVLVTEDHITAVPMAEDATVTITTVSAELITITVTAANGEQRIYTINQKIELPGNSLLESLLLDSALIKDFDPAVFFYNYRLPQGSQTVPAITALAQDTLAEVSITPGVIDSIPFRIFCTAQNGDESVYEVMFTTAVYSEAQHALPTDVLFRHIAGTNNFMAASIRLDVQIGVFDQTGHLIMYKPVPTCDPNAAEVTVDLDGVEHLTQVTDPDQGVTFEAEPNQIYFYTFFEMDKRCVTSGKFMLVP